MSLVPDSNAIKEDGFYTRTEIQHIIAIEREAVINLLEKTMGAITQGDFAELVSFMQEYEKPMIKFMDPNTDRVKKMA